MRVPLERMLELSKVSKSGAVQLLPLPPPNAAFFAASWACGRDVANEHVEDEPGENERELDGDDDTVRFIRS